MRDRPPISSRPTIAEVARHIDQLHTCLDITGEKVDRALNNYETMVATQQQDRHAARNRDQALLGAVEILLRDKGYEMEFDPEGALSRITPPPVKSLWDKLSGPATVIGTVLTALGSYKAAVAGLAFVHHVLMAAHQ